MTGQSVIPLPAVIRLTGQRAAIAAADAPADPVPGGDEGPRPSISGVLLPYGVQATPCSPYGLLSFDAGSIEVPELLSRVKLLRDHDMGDPIGVLVAVEDTAEALSGTFELAGTDDAAEALQLARDGVLDGFSVGVEVLEINEDVENGVWTVLRARLIEVSLVPFPAWDDARLTDIAAHRKELIIMPDNGGNSGGADTGTSTPGALTLGDLTGAINAAVGSALAQTAPAHAAPAVPADLLATGAPVRSSGVVIDAEGYSRPRAAYVTATGQRVTAGDYLGTFLRGRKSGDFTDHKRILAALAHETTSLVPGLLPQVILDPMIGTDEPVRRIWNSLTARNMPTMAGVFYRPRITQHTAVGEQTTEKTEVASQQLKVELDQVAKQTIAGALNISVQAIDWTSPGILDIVLADLVRVYMNSTETYAAQWLTAAAAGQTAISVVNNDPAAINGALYAAAAAVYEVAGNYIDCVADTLWMAPDVWKTLGALADTTGRPIYPYLGATNTLAIMDPGSPNAGNPVGSLRTVVSSKLAAGSFILGDSSQLEVYEDRRGLLRADEPSVLGVQVATYGYIGSYAVTPAAFQPITLTAPAEELAASKSSK